MYLLQNQQGCLCCRNLFTQSELIHTHSEAGMDQQTDDGRPHVLL